MRDKHIHIPQDSALLKTIYKDVDEKLRIDTSNFRLKIWTKFFFYFTLSVTAYIFLYNHLTPFLFIGTYVLYGFVTLLFAFNFSHDFSHNTIFKSIRLNHLCFIIIYTLVGAHAEAWKQRHVNSHHYAPNVKDYDSDLKITKLIRVIPHSEYYWYHKYQHIYASFAYTTYSIFWVFIKDFVILFDKKENKQATSIRYQLSFWLQKICYMSIILIFPMLYSGQAWHVVLIGFITMHLTQSLFLLFTFFVTHHVEKTEYPTTDENGYINTSWLMNQIKSSNDMHPFSETANFILGGFNNHIAHHLFPHVHHIHYPALNRILYSILHNNNIIPNQTSYWGGIVSHLKLLRRMSKQDS